MFLLFNCKKRKCRATKKILNSQTFRMSRLKISVTIKIIELILNGIKNKGIKHVIGIVNSTINDIKKNLKKELRKMYYSENIKMVVKEVFVKLMNQNLKSENTIAVI